MKMGGVFWAILALIPAATHGGCVEKLFNNYPCDGTCFCDKNMSEPKIFRMVCQNFKPSAFKPALSCYGGYQIYLEINNKSQQLILPWRSVALKSNPIRKINLSNANLACDCKNGWIFTYSKLQLSSFVRDNFWTFQRCLECDRMTPKTFLNIPEITGISRNQYCWKNHSLHSRVKMGTFFQDNCGVHKLKIIHEYPSVSCEISANQRSDTCITWKTKLFFTDFNADKLEPAEISCSKIVFDLNKATVVQSSWLLCSLKSDIAPQVRVTMMRIQRKPIFLSIEQLKQSQKDYSLNFTLLSSTKLTIRWQYISRSKHAAELWDIIPDLGYRFRVIGTPGGVSDGFMRHGFVATFADPNIKCTGGEYIVRACNDVGCTSEKFTVFSSSPPCATVNSTFFITGTHIVEMYDNDTLLVTASPKPTETNNNGLSTQIIFGAVSACVVCLAALLVACGCVGFRMAKRSRRNRRQRSGLSEWTTETAPLHLMENKAYASWWSTLKLHNSVPVVPPDEIDVVQPIGEGAFGCVYLVHHAGKSEHAGTKSTSKARTLKGRRASLLVSSQRRNSTCMAMKTLKFLSCEKLQDLEREAALLTKLNHPNIVTFFGLTLRDDGGFALLFEFMELGDLVHYLREHNPDLNRSMVGKEGLCYVDLLRISIQVAAGLEYLWDNHLVHRDLAARNCLVSKDRIVKLSDFGMTRDLYVSNYYKMDSHTMVPLRWLPPESILYRKFTAESDMWSFGVLIWEVFSFGQVPWYSYSNSEVLDIVKTGQVLQKPDVCPEDIYTELILNCCLMQQEERLTARAAKEILENFLEKSQEETTYLTITESFQSIHDIQL